MKRCNRCQSVLPESEFYVCKAEKDGLQRRCKDCVRYYRQQRMLREPDVVRQKKNEIRKRNIEKYRSYQRAYDKKAHNKERKREYERRYNKENPEIGRNKSRRWAERHPEKKYLWKRNNPVSVRLMSIKRRALERSVVSTLTAKEWFSIKILYGKRCLCCGKSGDEVVLSVDHIIPLSAGGSNTAGNVQPLCVSCNAKKHTHVFDYRPIHD